MNIWGWLQIFLFFAVVLALTKPMGDLKRSFPVPSAGIHPGLVPKILADYGKEVIVIPSVPPPTGEFSRRR